MPDNQTSPVVDDGQAPRRVRSALRGRLLTALVVLAVAASFVVWVSHANNAERSLADGAPRSSQTAGGAPPGSRGALAGQALERQARALARGSLASYLAAWDTSSARAQSRAETTYHNLRALGVTSLGTRYAAADAGLTLAVRKRLRGDAWNADVEVSYALAGYDSAPAQMTVEYTFVERADRVFIADVRAVRGERAPIWLYGRLRVRRSGRTLVAASSAAEARRVDGLLGQAADDVGAVLPRWDGALVAYVTGSTRQLESLLAAVPGSYDTIASVTTTVDGSDQPDAPVAIMVNATVFDRLGPLGSHVVITHEATHAATNAAVVGMPLWVAEGFADYVGVGAVDLPISVSAREVIRAVRRDGVPAALPGNADFSAANSELELAYEQAWLANRLIAAEYGERSLVKFYSAVVTTPADMAGAFDGLGSTEDAFTADWRRSLEALAARR